MRLALLLVSLSLLQGCIAPAVSDAIDIANYASPFPDTTSSLAASNTTANTCKDLDHCRSLVGIITSCIATIFACVWVAVHPNIPGPKQSWISRQFESFKLVVMTLLVPEWVLAWAARQFLQARHYARELESVNEVTTGELYNERASLIDYRYSERIMAGPPEPPSELGYLWQLESDLGRTNQSWTITHGFLMTMGGFHIYRGGQPTRPLEYHEVLALVKSRALVPPTSDELGDKSKGDALSKTIAILQTLWFVAQCIARRVENLAITNLEIVTLAYTAITVAMYAAWWHKPLNMRCPVRVKGAKQFVKNTPDFEWFYIIDYVTGNQDCRVTLSGEERVPTFWSSCSTADNSKLPLYADVIALSIAMVFGAIHCAAWSYVFPSPEQQTMWRVCALVIAAIPLPMAVAFAVFDPFGDSTELGLSAYTQIICMSFGALLYILARIILLVLAFTTLRQLPLSVYQTVQWTTWIPHL